MGEIETKQTLKLSFILFDVFMWSFHVSFAESPSVPVAHKDFKTSECLDNSQQKYTGDRWFEI